MKGRLLTIVLCCLIVDGAAVEQKSLADRAEGKYGHFIFDRIDNAAKQRLPDQAYNSFSQSLSSIAKPRETIMKARNTLIKDNDSEIAKATDFVLHKFFMLTLLVGTVFGVIIKVAVWAISGG